MDQKETLELLKSIKEGALSPEAALDKLIKAPFDDLGYAVVDNHRAIRQGVGEVVFGSGKTPEQICGIVKNLADSGAQDILVTRLSAQAAEVLGATCNLEYHELPQLGIVNRNAGKELVGSIVIASGGTSDMAVCEEAALTAEALGNNVTRLYDVGVAGLHRLLSKLYVLSGARVVIAVAGMEGALPSVVGGLVSCPVIAVPTSIGYGANFGGLSALLAMLNSCSSGIAVVNIDNGFGAGFIASRINKMEGLA
ncbi:MAG: nickel pincer cofactor biosynthesis protein LarB [Eubacteriaceae bacterium]|nr:nickel pincer cofactor biosynthesis protein LarB [Eubacteriaceae bacterium]